MSDGNRATTTLTLISLLRRASPDLYSRLARKRFPFGRRNMQVSRDVHGIRGFEAACGLVFAELHVAACAGAEEDGVAYGGYESVPG
jgi:hypothetical protein